MTCTRCIGGLVIADHDEYCIFTRCIACGARTFPDVPAEDVPVLPLVRCQARIGSHGQCKAMADPVLSRGYCPLHGGLQEAV